MDNTQNTYKSYPHPILGNANDISHDTFSIDAQVRLNKENYEFKIHNNLEYILEETYLELLKEKKIIISYLFNCPTTLFRKSFCSYNFKEIFKISKQDIVGRLEITSHIVADAKIENLIFNTQNKIFDDTSFEIAEGEWLGISNTVVHFIEPIDDKKNRKPIIQFNKSENNINGIYKVNSWAENIIYIDIPKKIFDLHENLNRSNKFRKIYTFSLIIPILIEAITFVEDDEYTEDYKDCKWYTVIEEILKDEKYDEIDENYIKAQMILESKLDYFYTELEDIKNIIDASVEAD